MTLIRPGIECITHGVMLTNANPQKHMQSTELQAFDTLAVEHGISIANRRLIMIEPGGYGGNHTHLHKELIVCLSGTPVFMTRSKDGKIIETPMKPDGDGKLQVFLVTDDAPHAVINTGDETAILFEIQSADTTNTTPLMGSDSFV